MWGWPSAAAIFSAAHKQDYDTALHLQIVLLLCETAATAHLLHHAALQCAERFLVMQVLLQLGDTKLKRTASLMCPDLFQFEQHFEFLEIIGRSQHSEVSGTGLMDAFLFRQKLTSAELCLLLQHT